MFCHIDLQATTNIHDLPKLLDVPLAVRARMWYMHDGASAHCSRAARGVLNNTYDDRGIGTGGTNAWPPRSPDLNPLWGHVKALVCAAPVDNEEALHHRIVDACQTIRNYRGVFERMRLCMMRRVDACIEDILSSHYKYTLSALTHKLNVSGHMLI
jgi:hypothetical protein